MLLPAVLLKPPDDGMEPWLAAQTAAYGGNLLYRPTIAVPLLMWQYELLANSPIPGIFMQL